jgi:hypothetical protein
MLAFGGRDRYGDVAIQYTFFSDTAAVKSACQGCSILTTLYPKTAKYGKECHFEAKREIYYLNNLLGDTVSSIPLRYARNDTEIDFFDRL